MIYNATRQLVLRSVDGVVFVADSQWEKMEENVESFKNLEDNLAKQNISIDEIPYVLQYNKRDLENIAPVNYLEFLLNNRKSARKASKSSRAPDKMSSPRSTPSRRFCCTNSANKARRRAHRAGSPGRRSSGTGRRRQKIVAPARV